MVNGRLHPDICDLLRGTYIRQFLRALDLPDVPNDARPVHHVGSCASEGGLEHLALLSVGPVAAQCQSHDHAVYYPPLLAQRGHDRFEDVGVGR